MSYENMHKKAERLARERIEMENRRLANSPKIERVDDPAIWRTAYDGQFTGTVMNHNGDTIRILDFKVPEDRKFYEDWENLDQMKRCGPDEVLVRGYWTRSKNGRDEVYHQSYCRKKSEVEESHDNVPRKEFIKPDYSSERVYKCSEGFHWVKKHMTKNGVVVEGHCAQDPYRNTRKWIMDMNSSVNVNKQKPDDSNFRRRR